MSGELNFRRIYNMLRMEIIINRKSILISFISLLFICLFLDTLPLRHAMEGKITGDPVIAYLMAATIYGAIVTAGTFSELNFTDRKTGFLMLPASTFEKYISKFIYTTICFAIITLSAFAAAVLIVEIWNPSFRGTYLFKGLFSSFSFSHITFFIQRYAIFHSIFFFGAVYFRKIEAGKVILVYFGFLIFIFMYNFILNVIPFFRHMYSSYDLPLMELKENYFQYLTRKSAAALISYNQISRSILVFILRYIMPLFFWILAYQRLKESEVRNGV